MNLTDRNHVNAQYATAVNLNQRIGIHEKYSRNKQGFGPWIVSQYRLEPGMAILELGCGTGSMWRGAALPAGCRLVLTDFSEGMLEEARANTAHLPGTAYRQADAQEIPFDDDSFDVVIANMMLYHVSDIQRALREIRRVLRPDGVFYAATYGEHGVVEAVAEMLDVKLEGNHRFTLQNGGEQLGRVFGQVSRADYDDALDVTNPADLVAYLRSMASMKVLSEVSDETLLSAFRARMADGVLRLPKEYGLFICRGAGESHDQNGDG